MRTIKFRGKRCDNGEWVYGYYVESHHSWHGYHPHKAWILDDAITNGGFFALKGKRAVVNESVGQFTGLHDKNGKEIYEGDILQWSLYGFREDYKVRQVVEFRNGAFGYVCDSTDTFVSYIANTNFDFWAKGTDARFEVIGNIHDNPELMKGGKDGRVSDNGNSYCYAAHFYTPEGTDCFWVVKHEDEEGGDQ